MTVDVSLGATFTATSPWCLNRALAIEIIASNGRHPVALVNWYDSELSAVLRMLSDGKPIFLNFDSACGGGCGDRVESVGLSRSNRNVGWRLAGGHHGRSFGRSHLGSEPSERREGKETL
jgi:hypothetical protein